MARKAPSVPLSDMTGGINTFDSEAGESQTVDAIDVIQDGGDLVRRPAFVPVAHGPFYRLPAGRTYVIHEYPLLTYTNNSNRILTAVDTARIGGSVGRLWFGCEEPFDGIDVRHITAPAPTANCRIAIKYRTSGGALLLARGVVDTTNRRRSLSLNTNRYHQPLMQDGYISWHRSQFSGWALSTINGISRYWIALDVTTGEVDEGGSVPAGGAMSGGNITIDFPGIRAFVASPINGMYACKLKNSAPTVVLGADVSPKRGRENGASLAYWRNVMSPIDIARSVSYEGTGIIDQVTTPAWSHAGAPTGTAGTSGDFTKLDHTYEWRVDELRGSILAFFVPTAGSTTTTINTTVGATWTGKSFENHRLWCELNGSGIGTPIGSWVEIVEVTATTIRVYPALSIAPDTQNMFYIQTPPLHVRTREAERNYELLHNASPGQHNCSLYPLYFTATYSNGADYQRYNNFEVGRELWWAYESGRAWSFAYNSTTGRVLMVNGNCPVLEYDGIRTRELTCLSDPTDGVIGAAKVQDWNAAVEEVALTLGVDRVPVFLRAKPPIGKYIVDFHSHIVVAGLKDRENVVQWSAPGVFNDIWPNGYETQIRDGENSSINGMWTLGSQLIVSTVSGLFASDPPDELGRLIFHPVSQGLGFSSHFATTKIAVNGRALLVGACSDGIRAFTGAAPVEILDRWERVIPKGVNVRALSRAVAASSLVDNLLFMAVPEAGSDVNNRLIVYDYALKKFWLWTAPFGGISSITRDILESGKEVIYFGHVDGTVSVLGHKHRDGGALITGRAKSKSIRTGGAYTAFTGVMVNSRELGIDKGVTVRTYLNDKEQAAQTSNFAVTASPSYYPIVAGPDAAAGTFAQDMMKTVRVNLVNASVGTAFQYELEFTSPFARFRGATLIATPKGQRHAT